MLMPIRAMNSEIILKTVICLMQAVVPGRPLAKLDTRKMPVMKSVRSVSRSRNIRFRLNELGIIRLFSCIFLMDSNECIKPLDLWKAQW